MVKSLKRKKAVALKNTLNTADKKDVVAKKKTTVVVKKAVNVKPEVTVEATLASNHSHISLLSPFLTSDRKRKTAADPAAGPSQFSSLKMQDIEYPTKNDVLMGRGGK